MIAYTFGTILLRVSEKPSLHSIPQSITPVRQQRLPIVYYLSFRD
ncbi:hypothetical protein JCM19235_3634 [Vibrio maritimus]|uniref:Uncharacterized protein n=1 Tax=Vibrio maritimus TaxID=990268 RepID=A0A090SMM0_9VIBR|nr:hypothetical protein JCM19235_3634 [Vibrio maritimus]